MGKLKRAVKPNAKGRSEGRAKHVRFDTVMLESAAYASLTLASRALLQELRMIFNGSNNGSLYLSVRDAVARLGLGDDAAVIAAFDQLQRVGFIELAKDAHFEIRASENSRARTWRLSWEAWPECPVKSRQPPTHRWRDFEPSSGTRDAKRADKRLRALARFKKARAQNKMPVVDSLTMEAQMAQKHTLPMVESPTASREIDANQPHLVVVESPLYVHITKGSTCSGWWKADAEAQISSQLLLLAWMTQNGPRLRLAA